MPRGPVEMDDRELENFIQNHRRQKATDRPAFLEALREQSRRKRKGLDFEKSKELITEAAQKGQFLSYKALAEASGTDWQTIRYLVNPHLGDLVEYAHRKGWPMLSAIVVNKPNVETGQMDPRTLSGFIRAAEALGYKVDDPASFLREQQDKVFAWATDHPDEAT